MDQVIWALEVVRDAKGETKIAFAASKTRPRKWVDVPLSTAVGVVATTYIRHNLTAYDRLLRLGMGRSRAQKVVRTKVADIFHAWLEGEDW